MQHISQCRVGAVREIPRAVVPVTRHIAPEVIDAVRQSGIGLLLLVGACLVDASAPAAKMLASDCSSTPMWSLLDWSLWVDHFLAYPLTSLAMSGLCVREFRCDLARNVMHGLWSNVVMTATMVPAGALASRVSSIVASAWTTQTYAITMAFAAMCISSGRSSILSNGRSHFQTQRPVPFVSRT